RWLRAAQYPAVWRREGAAPRRHLRGQAGRAAKTSDRAPLGLLSSCSPKLRLVMRRWSLRSRIGHELHQRAVWITKIDAGARALRAEALHRSAFNGNGAALQMCNRIRDRPDPFETQIAVARRDRDASDLGRLHAGPMNIELPIAEAIGIADRSRHQFGA